MFRKSPRLAGRGDDSPAAPYAVSDPDYVEGAAPDASLGDNSPYATPSDHENAYADPVLGYQQPERSPANARARGRRRPRGRGCGAVEEGSRRARLGRTRQGGRLGRGTERQTGERPPSQPSDSSDDESEGDDVRRGDGRGSKRRRRHSTRGSSSKALRRAKERYLASVDPGAELCTLTQVQLASIAAARSDRLFSLLTRVWQQQPHLKPRQVRSPGWRWRSRWRYWGYRELELGPLWTRSWNPGRTATQAGGRWQSTSPTASTRRPSTRPT